MSTRRDLTVSGTYKMCSRNSPSPLVMVSGLGTGVIAPFMDVGSEAGSKGDNPTLQPIGFRLRLSQTAIWPATAVITANGSYEFTTGGLPLWFTLTVPPGGTVTFFIFDDAIPTKTDPTVNLSNGVVLDAVPVNYPDDLRLQFQLASDGAIKG